jgi:preprotein translocase subunit SecF
MIAFWRIFNRIVLVCVTLLTAVDASAWMGAEAPDRFFSAMVIGAMAGSIWGLFGATVHRMLE